MKTLFLFCSDQINCKITNLVVVVVGVSLTVTVTVCGSTRLLRAPLPLRVLNCLWIHGIKGQISFFFQWNSQPRLSDDLPEEVFRRSSSLQPCFKSHCLLASNHLILCPVVVSLSARLCQHSPVSEMCVLVVCRHPPSPPFTQHPHPLVSEDSCASLSDLSNNTWSWNSLIVT